MTRIRFEHVRLLAGRGADIYIKIFYRDVKKFVRHLCLLVLRHQMRVSNYFVNSFYSAGKYVDRFWKKINRSEIHERGNWD